MLKRRLTPYSPVALLMLFALGCSSQSPTLPNPFTTADRVPPPPLRTITPGTAQPYYPATPAAAAPPFNQAAPFNSTPGLNPAPTFNQTAPQSVSPAAPWPQTSAYPGANPYPAANPYPGTAPNTQPYAPSYQPQTTPVYPGAAPGPGPLGSTQSLNSRQFAAAPGDAVAIPGDASSLRFASPTSIADARSIAANSSDRPQLASRPATANSWIAGTAPVRQPASGASPGNPRIRVPGASFERQPVSIAALDRPQGGGGSVAISPLEPAPFAGAVPSREPAPLRVATPSTTGWR